MSNLMLLEDDLALSAGIKIALEKDLHSVYCFYTMTDAFEAYTERAYDLLLLDINLPDGSGLDFCYEMRKLSDVPIIFITANDTESDMLDGFKSGCDDYISKPFSTNVLRQKVLALIRRTNSQAQNRNIFLYNEMRIDLDSMSVTIGNKECKLTATEYRLLEYMALNKGKVLTRSMLLERIWDIDENFVDENTLSVHIKRLRDKLENDNKNPKYMKTVFGIGYTFGE